ncbi:RNA polymerase sigma factor [Nonomuraea turcica]|uniref:RNA polymerase sigma factor n=1 Tax=Nonomuraea sp. G32 TaxID=3067274 RepID=UPI00273CBA8F|nr:hypothetical protein [Nonomuraea sp. G32]MDP4511834.1 hypothetical protein [Nonomuraea sp. G32]
MTWHALTDDARAAIEEVCQAHGAALFDYCRTELTADDAERAACGALLSAHQHAGRLADTEHLRAWLYALARAHRTARAAANPAGAGSWSRPGVAEPLLGEALAALPRLHREALDLALRHGLTDVEIALIFDAGAIEIEHLVTDAAGQVETWIAAVNAARAEGGCPALADLAAEPGATLARRRRAAIARHIAVCPTCQAAPRTAGADTLVTQLPIAAAPATMTDRLAEAAPLAPEVTWRSDGFPAQADTLAEALAEALTTIVGPVPAGPTTPRPTTGAVPAPAAGKDDFRAWERRSRDSEEFWSRRDDEADPEARLTLRPLVPALRVSGLIAAAVASVLAAGAAWSALQPDQPSATVAPVAAPATITLLGSQPPPLDPLPEDPPAEQPTQRPTSTPTAARPTGPATKPPASRKTSPPGHPAKAATDIRPEPARTPPIRNGGPQDPPRPTRQPTASSTIRKLPKPPSPTASLSPSSLTLGTSRSGSFTLHCTGTCQVTSASGSNGITVSGTHVSVSAPRSRTGCTSTTESGTATIFWNGTTSGDGRTSEGTTTGGGTLILSVSWTVEADKGTWVATGDFHPATQGYWSNCPNG